MKQNDSIQNELKHIAPTLLEIGNATAFKVPSQYFENIAELVCDKAKNQNEIEAVLPFSKLNQHLTPENYFENLWQEIDLKKENSLGELDAFSKTNAFTIPENYFDNLADNMLAKAKELNTAETTISFSKTNQFSTPENYFESNVENILASIKNNEEQKNGKIISWFNTSIVKFSAAASVAAMIIGMAILFQHPKQEINQNLTAQDIKCYLQTHTEEVDDLQLTEKIVKSDMVKPSIKNIPTPITIEKEKTDLKNYLENELDEEDLNDAI
ncbi:MAG: hypothetical protein RL708_377 [Bacteroidota bacterium]|jgi:hypothetical protein